MFIIRKAARNQGQIELVIDDVRHSIEIDTTRWMVCKCGGEREVPIDFDGNYYIPQYKICADCGRMGCWGPVE